ncbi:hypothetical protein MGS_03339 [Candida albicans P78042]|nr:hypothetical protein MGS_03339 [Candida albicans P78042]
MSMPGSIDPPGQGQAPIIMNQGSLRYLGSVIAESVNKSQDVVKPTNFKGGNRSGGEERGVDADGDIIMANSMQSKKLSWTERKFLKQNNACYTCYRVGHKSFDCPYRKDNKKNPPKQTNKSDLN